MPVRSGTPLPKTEFPSTLHAAFLGSLGVSDWTRDFLKTKYNVYVFSCIMHKSGRKHSHFITIAARQNTVIVIINNSLRSPVVFELPLRILFNVFGLFWRNFCVPLCINSKHHFWYSILCIDCKFTRVSFIKQLGLKKKS